MDKVAQAETLARFVAALPGGPGQPANRPADIAAAGTGLPVSAVGWAVTLGRRCSDAVLAAMGEDAAWLPEDETRRGIEFSVLSAVRRLIADVRDFPLSPDQVSLAHKMARHGLPYERFMLGLRMVQEILLEALLDEAARYRPASGPDGRGTRDGQAWLPGALALATSKFLDESAAAMVSEYLAESQRVIARAVASQRRTIAALLAGDHVPDDVAARILGISLGHHHLALVLWNRERNPPPGARAELEAAASKAAAALRAAGHVAIHDDGDEAAGLCWISRAVPFPADYPARLTRALVAGEFRAAVGAPAPGPAGFRRSYLAARDAERTARQGLPGKVTAYRDVDLIALLTADPERAQWFVAAHLGKLAAQDDETLADLRATALCYLESGCSLVKTAAALHVHRNTVLYRLGSIERLLGRDLVTDPLAVHAALALAQRLGPALLDHDFTPRPQADQGLADATYL
jgi:PucR C-terminal helix-turn-helix domain/GGDEF-like domain